MKFDDIYRPRTEAEVTVEQENTARFEEQWAGSPRVKIENDSLIVYDISPDHEKTPVPTLVIPGWNLRPETWKENIRGLVASGRRTLSVDSAHGVDVKDDETDTEVPDSERRKIAAFMGAIDAQGVKKVDAIAHSEGCIDVLYAAARSPERFRNIVLVNPGGMIGEDSSLNLALRFTHDALLTTADVIKRGRLSEQTRLTNAVLKNAATAPIHSFKEMQSIAAADIADLLRVLKEKGIGIVIIHGASDAVFPMERMTQTLHSEKADPTEDITSILDGFYSVAGGHTEFVTNPEPYTRLAEGALTALEEKARKREAVTS